MFALLTSIQSLLDNGTHVVVAIDGRCCSGKTTLAAFLARRFGGRVVHIDDFFLPFDLRTPDRLAQIGGNIHAERLMQEVLSHIRDTKLYYNRFSCRNGRFEQVRLTGGALTVVEGSYSLLPQLRDFYDLTVFCTIGASSQRKRVTAREGERAQMFFDRWIPMEERYFAAYHNPVAADIILDMEDVQCSN